MSLMAVSRKSRLLTARFHIEACHRCRVAEEGFHSQGEYSYDVELNASANKFYLLKHLLLLNLIIFKLKCNNLTFNEMLILYASYVCLLHSSFIENHPIWILEYRLLISEVVLS
jgi:hypothetical protein